jgi:hypothetical protein
MQVLKMSAPLEGDYGLAGTKPLRDISDLPYVLLHNYIKDTWNETLAYGITLDDVEFGTTPDENNEKDIIVTCDPQDSPINEDVEIYEKFSQELHFVDILMFVKTDAALDTNLLPEKLRDLIRYMKKVVKIAKIRVPDIEGVMISGEGPIAREPLSEWYGYSITIALGVYMVTKTF